VDIRIQCVTVDAHDCELLATFWSSVLGWRITLEYDDEWAIEPPEGSSEEGVAPDILFVKVPDEKVVKNRLHFDLRPKDQAAEVERILGLGATHADIGQSDVSWVVLADPEGNEFCVLRPLPDADRSQA
jgi:predicted enzyme related to lactoylglutathione lyase